MDVMHACRCCLQSPSEMDLTTPYMYHGKTEIYFDMIEKCFDIRLVRGPGSCGICSACVGRLRDASDFKLQVQRSQAELQGLLLNEEPVIKSEPTEDIATDSVFNTLHLELVEDKPDTIQEEMGDISNEDPLVKLTAPDQSGDIWTLEVPLGEFSSHAKKLSRKKQVKRKKETKMLNGNDNASSTKTTSTKNKLYSCDRCGKQFKEKYLLGRHIKIHMTIRDDYPCTICDKTLLSPSALQRHLLIHNEEKKYTCEECKLQFTQKGNLARHRRIHTGERPFVCDDCDKQFANRSNLDRHVRIHKGDKPYRCEKCRKRFSQKNNLRMHICSFYDTR
ncbi:zinc finger protein 888-like isoform X2 [Leguminivora glycinivorella]|uniref:zinc finger protein 888-like isoform X2 n=1 Tax=Leguminivora glycinivorella TaxID=1035111 RepID=UPI00200C98B3|nr:zinc finger protein 888-like isoform X2 [Leguminivora glycinivorella]